MATQSLGNASQSSSSTTAAPGLEKQASLQSQVPPETMAALVNNTNANGTGENRKISFVLAEGAGEDSKTSSQTTLAMQVSSSKDEMCTCSMLGIIFMFSRKCRWPLVAPLIDDFLSLVKSFMLWLSKL